MPITLDGTNGITTPTYGGADTSEYLVPVTQFKNRIINGAMVIDQRNAGASVTPTNAQFSVDRWQCFLTQASKYSVQQSTTAPVGFVNSLLFTSLSAFSVASGDTFYFKQAIEGLNVSDLAWGTANAKTVTLSFQVRSSLTGTFGGALFNSDGSRSYPFSYTVSSANTWTTISVTIAGDTSGTWLTTNGIGINVVFGLGSGSTFTTTANAWAAGTYVQPTGTISVVGTNGATFYITGVQLEVGSTATSFDYRPYGTELQLCQRYYEKSADIGTVPANGLYSVYLPAISHYIDNLNSIFYVVYKVTKRANPTLTFFGGADGKWQTMKTDGTWGTILGSTYPAAANTQAFCGQNSDWNGSSSWQTITAGTGRMARGDWVASAEL